MPFDLIASEEEFHGAESLCHEVSEKEVEQTAAAPQETELLTASEVPEATKVEEVAVAHSVKKMVKRKEKRALKKEATHKKKKVVASPAASRKGKEKAPHMGRERRVVIFEQGLPIDFPIPAFVKYSISALGFQDGCIGLEVIHPQMVLDFYEGEKTTDKGLVLMPHEFCRLTQSQSMKSSTSPMRHYKETRLSRHLQKTTAKIALSELCIEGAKWNVSASGARTLALHWLKIEEKFCIHWVKNRFSPTMHDSSISRERIMIVYCLHKAIKFNLRELLHRELVAIHYMPKGPLFFPWLVENLCAVGEVFSEEDDAVELKCSYEWHSMLRIMMGSMDCPKTKREIEEEERHANLRREVQKGKQYVISSPPKKKKLAPPQDWCKVVLKESEAVPLSESDEDEII